MISTLAQDSRCGRKLEHNNSSTEQTISKVHHNMLIKLWSKSLITVKNINIKIDNKN